MHELSYATSVLNAILDAVKQQEELGRKVIKVNDINLEIGDLTLLSVDQLQFVFEVISEDTVCKGAELKAEIVKPKIFCMDCEFEGNLDTKDELEVACPKCESRNVKLKGGKEFNIVNATIEFDDEE
ncbi:hydrogenase nickel insertion protein HypA [Methanococcus maripaludis C5]|uniref:Hydrogenase maturation factor HypA n=1 Tax=Methanococcus maripaludis (strain C5 / ATCC BAA-1333) TaxID=402880 RepID=HYPA_METM5|nr:hydrogenase maturation nickel metallochaperone HypA [Methanococcus maripaludis]A4FZN7.1 RecName: Full=Hydrogenase maturation factor HypA [Methanococcus maripaludis C5]ABO35671.1 hydrogenase nickel insertion protein HypA [Methanococcus maripaludis C5]